MGFVGNMANAMALISSITLATATSSISFNSIPQNYRDLYIVITGPSGTTGTGSGFQFNGDTNYSSNYSRIGMGGGGSSAYSFSNVGSGNPTANHDGGAFGADCATIANIMDYSATDKHKIMLTRANRPANETHLQVMRWASTSAITTILISTDGATNLTSGMTFNLYGVIA